MLEQQASDAALKAELHRMRDLLDAADLELDHIVFQLRPIALGECGLVEAIEQHVKNWSELSQVQVDLLVDGIEPDSLPEVVEIGVFRVIQEALNNVAKHAHASRVNVALRGSRNMLAVSVEDDGAGFDAAAQAKPGAAQPGYGLAGMRERVEALGGAFEVEAAPGQGCAVLVRVPLG